MPAIDLPGQRIEARQIGEPLLALVALVDDPQHTVRPQRASVRAREPAADVLDPQHRCIRQSQSILQLIGHTASLIDYARVAHGVGTRSPAAGLDALRTASPRSDCL